MSTYAVANLAWLTTQSLPLLLWPSPIISLLREDYAQPTALELYFARSLGLALLALALLLTLLSGVLPLGPAADVAAASPFANAAFLVATIYHAAVAAYTYTRYSWTGETGFLLGCVGSSVLAAAGLYVAMFAGDTAMISRYHHFDQSTSGFPFANKESYRAKKKAL